ncbi:uncharacterized protein LOC131333674 isoform X2 [Rhododendron vialii]|uniref:uncharacterized protein LOC131333674 isoform X2 n=1 Tax=Rhododendron vialii TaxID=182163 RepID=UPI00265ED55B|nr:uncharacterized protein LOC131333674 isoform X2 [Rhododendron vialii]
MTPSCTCAVLVSPGVLTCKTCGRSSIEGMGHSCANMLDTSNLERTNFMDPELTWKTVKKGFRSSSRRSRKPARTLNVVVQQVDKSSKRGKPSVSESEKLGVAVLGRRFAEKIEHVPIKKRRPPLQSPTTPPQTPSPHCEESLSSQPSSCPQPDDFDQKTENKGISSPWWCSDDSCFPMAVQLSMKNDFVNNRKRSKVCNGKLGYTEDFSGIALLAAAACNSSTSDDAQEDQNGPTVDDFLTSGRIVSSISATPLGKSTTPSESGNLFLKESEKEESIDDLVVQDNSVVLAQNLLDKGESARKSSSSKKEVRLHWDLNTVMEAWELSPDDLNIVSQRNGSDDAPDVIVHDEKPEKLEGRVNYREHVHAPEQLYYSAARTEVSTQFVSKDKSLDTCLFTGSEPISNRLLSEEKINSSPTSVIISNMEASSGTSAILLGQKVFIENVAPGIHLDTVILGKVVCESDSIQAQEVSTKAVDLPGNRTSLTELVSSATRQLSDVGYASESGKSGLSNASPVHDNSSGLDTTFREGQPIVAVDVERKQDKEAPTADAVPMDSSFHWEMKELTPKYYECFGKVDLADAIDDGKGLDVSNRRNGPTVCAEKMNQIEGGYESPFEDGELRESVVYSCEENDGDGETECVDYDSDCRDRDGFNAANQCTSEVGSDSYVNGDNGGFPDKELQSGRANPLKGSNHSSSLMMRAGQNHFPEGFDCSTERTSETNNIDTQKKFAAELMEGHDVVGSSAGEVGSRASRVIFSSNFEGTSCSDALHRSDNVYMQRGRNDSLFQPGRMFTSEKYLERDRSLQHRNQGDSRNYYQTGYSQGTWYPRPRSIANSGAKIDGLTFRDQRRYTNYSSKDEHRPPIRQRSPVDSDDGYSASRRTVVARDNIDHIRSRGRGRIYGQGFSRVPREEYDGPLCNHPASFSVRPPHYISRRERSFSPIRGRGASFSRPQQNSRSRSRSRSLTFRVQRGRNMGVRRLSRSPEFRSDARMGRGRMPFPKSNYATYDEDGPISPSRTHFSSQRHPRWIDDENCESNSFVERKSPGRLIGARQKLNFGGFRGRTKSDECFRPMIRAGRFADYSDGGAREHKYSGGNREGTKYHDKYDNIEKNHGLRRRNTNGVTRRFRIDEKGCSTLRNSLNEESCINGTDRRDIQRSTTEGQSPFQIYQRKDVCFRPQVV